MTFFHQDPRPNCPSCGQLCLHSLDAAEHLTDEEVDAAENRWTCAGLTYFPGKAWAKGDPEPPDPPMRVECPGRGDIVAAPVEWALWKRAMKTRVKETKVSAGVYAAEYERLVDLNRDEPGHTPWSLPGELVPDLPGIDGRRGRWVLRVEFYPDPGQHEHVWPRGYVTSTEGSTRRVEHQKCVVCDLEREVEK